MKPQLHFAHGNGFPSPCYAQMLEGLSSEYDCRYIDKIGHNEAFPVGDNWDSLVQEVIESIKLQCQTPVIALGHSLGGVLSLLAAFEQPELFQCVVLLDAPLISPLRSRGIRLSKLLGFIDRITPAHRSKARRAHWQSREQAFKYLKRRELFKHFTDASINDYIDYGMTHDETGYTLRFDTGIEYEIYRTIPHYHIGFRQKLNVPAYLIYGSESDIVHALDRRFMARKFSIAAYKTQGTHMFPFEYPEETTSLVLDLLHKKPWNH